MDNTDLLLDLCQYLLGVIPGDIAGNVIAVVTFLVTACTLIMRFWKEPSMDSQTYKIWKIIHVLASFKVPKKGESDGEKAS